MCTLCFSREILIILLLCNVLKHPIIVPPDSRTLLRWPVRLHLKTIFLSLNKKKPRHILNLAISKYSHFFPILRKLRENIHLMRLSFSKSFMRKEKKLWIFYYLPIFDRVSFFIIQTLFTLSDHNFIISFTLVQIATIVTKNLK